MCERCFTGKPLKPLSGRFFLDDGKIDVAPAYDDVTAEATNAFLKSSDRRLSRNKPLLTERNHEFIRLVARGYHNGEIAQRLDISHRTVKNTLHAIFGKLGVTDRFELASYSTHSLIDHQLPRSEALPAQ
jgi:DNA-binding NarL/FixJ family response regulator